MRVMCIGGAGFIGSNTVIELVNQGCKVIVIDNERTGNPKNLESVWNDIRYYKGDKMNRKLLKKTMQKSTHVIDYAGYCSAPMFKPDPRFGVHESVNGFLNVLEEAKKMEIERVVFASSCVIYGNGPIPSKETDPLVSPRFFYAESKTWMERSAKIYSDIYDLETIGLRFFSNYGPHEHFKRLWRDDLRNVLTQCIEWVSKDQHPWFYGTGMQTRDYIFVKDTVDGVIRSLTKGKPGQIYNIGTGIETSYVQSLTLINEILGKNVTASMGTPYPPDYIMRSLGDTSKAYRDLGFKAKILVREGLELQIEDMKKEGLIH